ncbi:MAG: histidine--tRNA ligase [Clostridiales bacterium]|nr:histidine--tRNA ligase [Clostridiales bacterium]
MAPLTNAIKGTRDLLPKESGKVQYLEHTVMDSAEKFGYREIRTPIIEHTELFQRGVGDTTDVVQKEMYTFDDKGGRSITMRPEWTAGVARCFIENGLHNEPLPQKVYYLGPCYRYEKPQSGRYREFRQFGVECYGSADPLADAEVIAVGSYIFRALELDGISLEINSIGCPDCRGEYHKALKNYFAAHIDTMCGTCKSRLEKNPLRILDCKNPACNEIAQNAPEILDYLCTDCAAHFSSVKGYLDAMRISYRVNPRIVRGLDYYTRTVFEFVTSQIGAQGTVLGGGRYDGLVEELGGAPIPALGFAMGMERLQLLMEAQGAEFPEPEPDDLFLIAIGEEAKKKAVEIAADMRAEGCSVQYDLGSRSIRAQMKYADKLGARFTAVLGDDELKKNAVSLKDMRSGDTQELNLTTFVSGFYQTSLQNQLDQIDIGDGGMDFSTLFGLNQEEEH